jgi:hypothetical protein
MTPFQAFFVLPQKTYLAPSFPPGGHFSAKKITPTPSMPFSFLAYFEPQLSLSEFFRFSHIQLTHLVS